MPQVDHSKSSKPKGEASSVKATGGNDKSRRRSVLDATTIVGWPAIEGTSTHSAQTKYRSLFRTTLHSTEEIQRMQYAAAAREKSRNAELSVIEAALKKHKEEIKTLALKHAEDLKAARADNLRGLFHSVDKYNGMAVWYWEEDEKHISYHEPSTILPNTRFVCYSDAVCLELESAYHNYQVWPLRNQEYHLNITSKKARNARTGSKYTINFQDFSQTNASSRFKRKIFRKEKDQGTGNMLAVSLSGHSVAWRGIWHQSPSVNQTAIPSFSQEYHDVSTFFLRSIRTTQVQVSAIKRIQNLPLRKCYEGNKASMELKVDPGHQVNNTAPIEKRWLFHGTSEESVNKIIHQGFNRAYAYAKNGSYGKGTYFARDASYSLRYATNSGDGDGHIFLCRVLVGDWCQGRRGMIVPDSKPHNPMELFDTAVDNVQNPTIFVAFHDSQAYPEYLVTFKR